MKRTTIMADEDLLDRLREEALRQGVSLATVIRQGLEWRAGQGTAPLRFIGTAGARSGPHDTARRAGDIQFTPRSWR